MIFREKIFLYRKVSSETNRPLRNAENLPDKVGVRWMILVIGRSSSGAY